MNLYDHFVLTRFNVRTEFSRGRVPDDAWLRHRFQLFEQFAYPSMQSQSVEKFTWLVFFDEATAANFKQQIAGYAQCHNFVPYFVDKLAVGTEAAQALLSSTIRAHCSPDASHIITTRFDNDDAIGKHYLAHIQNQFAAQSFQFINFTNGYILRGKKLYKKRHLSNPFISLIEEAGDFRTVWLAGHHKLADLGNIVQVDCSPQWLQVVHRRNFRNRVGVGNLRVPLRLVRQEFCFDLPEASKVEPKWAIKLENKLKGLRMRSRKRLDRVKRAIKLFFEEEA